MLRPHALVLVLTVTAGCYVQQQQPQPQPAQQQQYGANGAATAGGGVFINGVAMNPADAQRAQIPAGRYWYDRFSGVWGVEGGPALGVTQAGLSVGAELSPSCSNGNSGVFVNGRQLQVGEVAWLQNLLGTAVQPGQYWLDHTGNMGVAGGPAVVNLMQVARSRGGGAGGGDNYWSHGRTGSFGNEQNGAGYVCTGGTCATYGM